MTVLFWVDKLWAGTEKLIRAKTNFYTYLSSFFSLFSVPLSLPIFVTVHFEQMSYEHMYPGSYSIGQSLHIFFTPPSFLSLSLSLSLSSPPLSLAFSSPFFVTVLFEQMSYEQVFRKLVRAQAKFRIGSLGGRNGRSVVRKDFIELQKYWYTQYTMKYLPWE